MATFPSISIEFLEPILVGETIEFKAGDLDPAIFTAIDTRSVSSIDKFSFNIVSFASLINDQAANFAASASASLSADYTVTISSGAARGSAGNIVTITSLVANASHDFGTLAGDALTNGRISVTQQINAAATTVIPSTAGAPQVNVTLYQHELKEFYPSQPKSFLYGNVGDLVTTTIEFTTREAISYIQFSYGVTSNDTDLYPNSDFTLSEDLFNSVITGQPQSYSGEAGTLEPKLPLSWDNGSVIFTDLTGNNYRLVHEHYINPLVRTEDNNNGSLTMPDLLAGNNSIQYVFKIDGRSDLIDPNPSTTTDGIDLTNLFSSGNVGHFGEFLNNGTVNYQLNSFEFDQTNGEINRAVLSTATGQIENLQGNFTATTDLILFIQEVADDFDDTLTLDENLNIERVKFQAGGVPVSGTNITNSTATFTTNQIDFSFEVVGGSYNGSYAVWIAVSNDTSTVNNQNVLLQVGQAGIKADESGVNFGTYPNALRTDFNFNYHYNNDVENSFNEIRSFIEDRVVNRWRIVDTGLTNELQRFIIQVKSTSGKVYRTITINAADIPFNGTRDFKLEDSDPKKDIIVNETVTDTWDFEYGFQIWDDVVDQTDVVFACQCVFIQTTDTGELIEFTKEFQSPDFEMGQYDTTKNTVLEPQVLRSTASIQFYDELTLTEVGGIIKGRDTRVTATFQDDNLNDLQANESDLTGYIAINEQGDSQNIYEGFHSTVANGALRPFEQITSFVPYLAKVTKVDIKTCTIEAVVVWNELETLFQGVEKFDVTARMDRLQFNLLCIDIETNFNPATDGTFDPAIVASLTGTWFFEDGSDIVSNSISTIANGLDGTDQIVQLCIDDFTTVTSIDFHTDKIINTLDLTKLVNVTSFQVFTNPDLLTLLLPLNNEVITLFRADSTGLVGVLNVSGFSALGGDFRVQQTNVSQITFGSSTGLITNFLAYLLPNFAGVMDVSQQEVKGTFNVRSNPLMTGVTHKTSTEIITNYEANSSGFVGVHDMSNIVISNTLKLNNNSLLTGVILPTSASVITTLQLYVCNITGILDMSTQEVRGNVRFYSNPLMTGVIFKASTGAWSNLIFNSCGIIGAVDFTPLAAIGGTIQFNGNPLLTQFTLPISTASSTNFRAYLCNITGAFDLSGLEVTNSVQCYQNPLLTSIVLFSGTNPLPTLTANGCNISTVNFLSTPNLFDVNNQATQLQSNTMTSAEVNKMLVDADSITDNAYSGRTFNIAGTNAIADTTSGGNNGIVAIANLVSKNITVTVNV